MPTPARQSRTRRSVIALVVLAAAFMEACDGKDAKAMARLKQELALLKAPDGVIVSDQRTGLGEMYAEGTQTYCDPADENAARGKIDSMLRGAEWERLTAASTPDRAGWRYRKGEALVTVTPETARQSCGWRFRVDVAQPL